MSRKKLASLVPSSLLMLVVSGCSMSANLTDELRQRLSKEDRQNIYERENAVTIAQSRLDEALLFIRSTKERIDQLGSRWDRAKARLEKANQAARIDGVRKIRDTQEAFLEDQLKIAEAHYDFRRREIFAARSRVELQKQRQLVKSGFAPEKTLEDFEKEVQSTDQDVKSAERRELDIRAESQKKFLDWKAAESEYARSSGDFDSLVWAD